MENIFIYTVRYKTISTNKNREIYFNNEMNFLHLIYNTSPTVLQQSYICIFSYSILI